MQVTNALQHALDTALAMQVTTREYGSMLFAIPSTRSASITDYFIDPKTGRWIVLSPEEFIDAMHRYVHAEMTKAERVSLWAMIKGDSTKLSQPRPIAFDYIFVR